MAEIQDVTEALSRILPERGRAGADIESIRYATISLDDIPALVHDPKRIVTALGVPVREHSQWTVSLIKKPEAMAALVRPVTVVIVHFDDCHGVIIIFY
ncbi:MAG TPA: hypothetical protein VNV39_08390 [Stellaceae bacterium]|jgi:hypothetical protein|nr:hypothetical protein [Stellaceae bacterium]